MKAVVQRTSELALGVCPDFVRAGYAVHEPPTKKYRLLEWWSLIYFEYEAQVEFDDLTVRVSPGYVALLPPGVTKVYRFEGPSPHYAVHFRVSTAVDAASAQLTPLPWLVDTCGRHEWMVEAFQEILANGAVNPARSRMRLWDLLFRVSDTPPFKPGGMPPALHPAVRQTTQLIETRLAYSLPVRWLADRVDLSPNHLTVLFRRHLGCTVLQYIRRRRTEQARHLLIHTDKRIKEIAAEVGMSDLQYFNKSIRAAYGMPPRALRNSK